MKHDAILSLRVPVGETHAIVETIHNAPVTVGMLQGNFASARECQLQILRGRRLQGKGLYTEIANDRPLFRAHVKRPNHGKSTATAFLLFWLYKVIRPSKVDNVAAIVNEQNPTGISATCDGCGSPEVL